MAILFLLQTGLCWAEESAKKKRRSPGRNKGRNADREFHLINGDAFVGLGVNFASGEYLDYLTQYGTSTNPNLLFNQESSTTKVGLTFGGQIRINPLKDMDNDLSLLSLVLGGSFLQRGFNHKVIMYNNGVPYDDETQLTEEFGSSHFLGQVMLRYGYRFFGEAGLTSDFFMGGYRKQTVNRFATGDQAPEKGFEASSSNNYNLSKDLMANGSLGFCFGVGYQVHKYAGVRIFNYFNSKYFKSGPDLSHFQTGIQILVSYP